MTKQRSYAGNAWARTLLAVYISLIFTVKKIYLVIANLSREKSGRETKSLLGARGGGQHHFAHPFLNRVLHQVQFAHEKVFGTFDKNQLLRFSGVVHHFLKFLRRRILVLGSADEQLRLRAASKEFVSVGAAVGHHRRAQRDQRHDVLIRTSGAHARRSAKGEASEDDGQ